MKAHQCRDRRHAQMCSHELTRKELKWSRVRENGELIGGKVHTGTQVRGPAMALAPFSSKII